MKLLVQLIKRIGIRTTAMWLLSLVTGTLFMFGGVWIATNPSLTFLLKASQSIVDINHDSPRLKVEFDGKDIRETGQEVRLVTLEMQNDGDQPIRTVDFSRSKPLRVVAVNGTLLEPPKIMPAEYEMIATESDFTFVPFVMNPGEAARIQMQMIQQGDVPPVSFRVEGKIAGFPTPTIVNDAPIAYDEVTLGDWIWRIGLVLIAVFVLHTATLIWRIVRTIVRFKGEFWKYAPLARSKLLFYLIDVFIEQVGSEMSDEAKEWFSVFRKFVGKVIARSKKLAIDELTDVFAYQMFKENGWLVEVPPVPGDDPPLVASDEK